MAEIKFNYWDFAENKRRREIVEDLEECLDKHQDVKAKIREILLRTQVVKDVVEEV